MKVWVPATLNGIAEIFKVLLQQLQVKIKNKPAILYVQGRNSFFTFPWSIFLIHTGKDVLAEVFKVMNRN